MNLSLKNKALALAAMVVLPFAAVNCIVAAQSEPVYREPAPSPTVVITAVPYLVVLPGTYVYAAPNLDVELYFFDGWWWHLENNYWYRSQSYSGGWVIYSGYPTFYNDVPMNWRVDYRQGQWSGQAWSYQRIQPQEVQTNWSQWRRSRHWESHNWGVQGPVPTPQNRPDRRRQPQGHQGQPHNPQAVPAQPHQPQGNPGQGHQPQINPGNQPQPQGNPGQQQPQGKPKKPKKPHGNPEQDH